MDRRKWTHRELVDGLTGGDRRALARALTLVENGEPEGDAVVREVFTRTGRAAVVGVTGPPGAGKSSLVGGLVRLERARGREVAVLSVDPSSPITHGALLGDRIRLTDHFLDPGVFIRSMATRGHLGGLTEATVQALLLLDAAGKDVVFLETVGAGQSEVQVAGAANVVVLVLAPGAGDTIQALKAGIMEIPDVIVVNKADQPGADATFEDIRATFALAPDRERGPALVRVSAATGEGLGNLLELIGSRLAMSGDSDDLSARRARALAREAVSIAAARLSRRLDDAVRENPAMRSVIEAVERRELDPVSAAEELVSRLGVGDGTADAR